jgi:predicted dehydrogenase
MKLRCLLAASLWWCGAAIAADLRIGIIGCDTSHATAFTDIINNPNTKGHVAGGRVVAGFKAGSADIPSSMERIEGYCKTLQEQYGVKFCPSIEELCTAVDAIMIESVDGRPHLAQVRPVVNAHKPVYVDKPMAGSLRDAQEMFRLAEAAKVPLFSASSLRFARQTQAVRHGSLGKVTYAETFGPCELEPHHPDLFWYGIHGVEALFTVMGTGCETVQRGTTGDGRIEVIGSWAGGRKGVLRADKDFHGLAKGEKGEAPAGGFDGYEPLVAEIMKFFQTGQPPVEPRETLEILAFMEAADQSKAKGGAPVKLGELFQN